MTFIKNPNFRSITPNEYIEKGTLVWLERNDHRNNVQILGPYIVEEGWGPPWFGSPNENVPQSKSKVRLLSTVDDDIDLVTWRSFLFTTYYVINEKMLCIDVKKKQK